MSECNQVQILKYLGLPFCLEYWPVVQSATTGAVIHGFALGSQLDSNPYNQLQFTNISAGKRSDSTCAREIYMKTIKDSTIDTSQRVIKKYPNRRLYDTASSAYITLSEVKHLVMAREAFEVRDAKNGENITRSILLQIILEEEANGSPMFTAPVLESLIRFYGHAMQGFLGGYLEKNIQSLIDLQTRFAEQSNGLSPEMWSQFMAVQPPALQALMGGTLEQSKAILSQMQDQIQRQAGEMLGAFGIKT
jgi:polyhydroxyalkanoate synthesis repressor PhaR